MSDEFIIIDDSSIREPADFIQEAFFKKKSKIKNQSKKKHHHK